MVERLQYCTDTTVDERYGTRTLQYIDKDIILVIRVENSDNTKCIFFWDYGVVS